MSPDEPQDSRLFTIRINSKAYTVAAPDLLSALTKAAKAFESIVGREFDPRRDRFEGSFRHKPKPISL